MKIIPSKSEGNTEKLTYSIEQILRTTELASLATIADDGTPYINTCYFAFDGKQRLFLFSDPKTTHGLNIAARPACALTVFNTNQPFASDLCGLQLFGKAQLLTLAESIPAFLCYAKKFPGLLKWAANIQAVFTHLDSRFFEITLERGKILDEPTFGKEVYIDFEIR